MGTLATPDTSFVVPSWPVFWSDVFSDRLLEREMAMHGEPMCMRRNRERMSVLLRLFRAEISDKSERRRIALSLFGI